MNSQQILSPSFPPTIPAWWRSLVASYGPRQCICHDGQTLDFDKIERRSRALARGLLAEGAGKGTRIGLLMPNGPEWLIAFLAITRVGGIAVALSTFLAAKEIDYAVRHADVALLLSADRYLRHDYVARLEEAIPGLAGLDQARPIVLESFPYLRSIWLTGDGDLPVWASGRLSDLEASGSASVIFGPGLLDAVEEAVFPAEQAMLIYTSGSTSEPKGVVHSHATIIDKILFLARARWINPWDMTAADRSLITGPFFWVGGFLVLGGALTAGATVLCVDEHSPQAILDVIRQERATQVSGGVAMLASLAGTSEAAASALAQLKPQNAVQRPFFNDDPAISATHFCNSLGMTETFGPYTGQISGDVLPDHLAGSFGLPLGEMEYIIVDPETGARRADGEDGEIHVRGPWLMDGFYKRDRKDVFRKDGFYATGDKGFIGADGHLFYKGRLSAMIKTSGANVAPEEVEVAIGVHPSVLEAAVIGLPHQTLGEMVVAAVALRPGAVLDEESLKRSLDSQLSRFKIPKHILFLDFDDFPRTPSRKVRKPALAEIVAHRLREQRI